MHRCGQFAAYTTHPGDPALGTAQHLELGNNGVGWREAEGPEDEQSCVGMDRKENASTAKVTRIPCCFPD